MKNHYRKICIIISLIHSFSYCLNQPSPLEWLSAKELIDLGLYFRRSGNYPAALDYFRFASLKDPLNYASKFELATTYLGCKKLKKGFDHLHDFLTHRLPFKNVWQGESLSKKSILVFIPYWGAGDYFMFARYIRLLQAYEPQNIILYCHEQFEHITKQFLPNVEIKTYNVPELSYDTLSEIYRNASSSYASNYYPLDIILQNLPESDYQVHLFSLPALFGTTEQSIPYELFDLSDVTLKKFWEKQFETDKKFKVGIYWQGAFRNDSQLASRAVPLELLQPILLNKQCSFYSLQFGFGAEQLANLDPQISLTWFENIDTFNGSFVDTAAIIQNLDLVITIDTSIAHLASILGAKVWLMLPFAADWRYQLANTSSPWYPNMRIFRQTIQGDWITVIKEIQKELVNAIN